MNSLDLATIIGFAVSTLVVLISGMTILRARQRVRNISEVGPRLGLRKISKFRIAMAGAIPAMSGELDSLDKDLKRAGFYSPNAIVEYLSARNFIVVFFMVIGGSLAVAAPPASTLPKTILYVTIGAILFAYTLPRLIVHIQGKSRLTRVQKGLPDALDIIRMCLQGGLPLRDSLGRVSNEIEFFHPDIAVELEVVRRHSDANTMTMALKDFAKRMDADEVNALASLLTQAERMGTHVAQAVTEFSDGLREQSKQRAEEKANKTTIKMLFPVVLCLAPPVLILLLGPPMLEMRNFFRDAHEPGGVLDSATFNENASASQ
ncbi:type II secretion system F family protein [bacterium]|nr:type II secretion system F family protein [bacterium]MDB4802750.1 type II secretion system F family protein [bacterium]